MLHGRALMLMKFELRIVESERTGKKLERWGTWLAMLAMQYSNL